MPALTATLALASMLLRLSFPNTVSANQMGSVIKTEGENLTITCTTADNEDRLCLFVAWPNEPNVNFYYDSKTKKLNTSKEYSERLKTSGSMKRLTIRVTDLQQKDSGLYICYYNNKQEGKIKEAGNTFLVVKERCPVKTLGLLMVMILLGLVCIFLLLWIVHKVNGLCVSRRDNVSRTHNVIYEAMHPTVCK